MTTPTRIALIATLSAALLAGCGAPLDSASDLSGPFLGQGDPPAEPQRFAPGIINTGLANRDVTMTPDGREMYFGVNVGNYALSTVLVSRLENGRWTEPAVASFAADPRYTVFEPFISPDGKRLFFASDRPHEGDGPARDDHDLWVAERVGDGWGPARPLSSGVNSDQPDFFASVTRDGTLYFTRDNPGRGPSLIMRARLLADGTYGEAEALPDAVNIGRTRFNATVAPDESYLIVPAYGMEDSRGATDYYVVFRAPDDTWSEPVNLGDAVNTSNGKEYSAYVSPDGHALFFMSGRQELAERAPSPLTVASLHDLHAAPGNGLENIWWMDASFLMELAP
jgi:hypothetical protein